MTPPEAAPMREDVTQQELTWEQCAEKLGWVFQPAFGQWYHGDVSYGVDDAESACDSFGYETLEAARIAVGAPFREQTCRLAHTARPDAGDEVERARVAAEAWLIPSNADGTGEKVKPRDHCVWGYEQGYAAAMREGVDRGMVEVPREVVAFLKGEGPLDGWWFGETRLSGERGNFWWRKHLPNLAALSRKGG